MKGHSLVRELAPPYETLRTLYKGTSEVRLYRNNVTGAYRVGKRVDLLGVEEAVAVNEATTLEAIDHPNVVPIHDVFKVSGYPPPMNVVEIVMPFFPRGSIWDAFERGEGFSLLEACQAAQAALLGLQHLHEVHGIVHRDVKSGNLILAEDGSFVKVGDLGVAARMDKLGTVPAFEAAHPYIAPETYTKGTLRRSADIFGMGLVLFEMASGPLPYAEYSVDGLASRLEKGRPGPRPRDLRHEPHVPKRLRGIVNKAIKVDPASRFATAHEMGSALGQVRMINWRVLERQADSAVWEGTSVQRPDRRFRVSATRSKRLGAWKISGLQRVKSWRRVCPDLVVGDLYDSTTAGFFEDLVVLATTP